MAIQYRKSKTGQWVAFGPQAEMLVGPVTVTTKSGGTKQETITRVGPPFLVDGIPHCYGDLRPRDGGSEQPTSMAQPPAPVTTDRKTIEDALIHLGELQACLKEMLG